MSGLGYQELLLIVAAVGLFFFVDPGIHYVVLRIGLRLLKRPARVLVAVWILDTLVLVSRATPSSDAAEFMILILFAALLAIPTLVLNLVWLWLVGSLWRSIGWTRLGTAWKETAALFRHPLRPIGEQPV